MMQWSIVAWYIPVGRDWNCDNARVSPRVDPKIHSPRNVTRS